MADCPKCKRPVTIEPTETQCYEADSPMCRAYRAGLAAGVALAKRTAFADLPDSQSIDWTETDAELRREGER